jgi:Fe-S cluster biosynthesis and repair protein YggX
MPTVDERITQFENMAAEDPTNDMAHFSLGNAYLQAERHREAAASLKRAIELNPEMSKAYQLAGEALIGAGEEGPAIEVLERGYQIASARGDMMPKQAITALLEGLGRKPPELSAEAQAEAERIKTSGAFICKATGRPGTQLPEPPMRGALGAWIHENIAAETWHGWIGQGTKVINELRLDFSREEDQEVYDQQMCEFLGIDETLYRKLTSGAG